MTIFCSTARLRYRGGRARCDAFRRAKQRISIARALLVNAEILILVMRFRRWTDALSTRSCITCVVGAGKNGNHQCPSPFCTDGSSEIIVMQHGHIAQRGNHDVRHNKAAGIAICIAINNWRRRRRRSGKSRGGRRCVVLANCGDSQAPVSVRFTVA